MLCICVKRVDVVTYLCICVKPASGKHTAQHQYMVQPLRLDALQRAFQVSIRVVRDSIRALCVIIRVVRVSVRVVCVIIRVVRVIMLVFIDVVVVIIIIIVLSSF